jgi:hypothetical protein
MKASSHMPNQGIEYQGTDACYLNLPPDVRQRIWKDTGLGSGPLVWRNQIFDCEFCSESEFTGVAILLLKGAIPRLQIVSFEGTDMAFR